MTIDLNQVHAFILVMLPALVASIAGLLRQDKLSPRLNESLLYAVILIVSGVQALLDGKLGGSPLTDFMVIGTYCTAFVNSAPGKKLLTSIQSATSIGGKAPTQPPALPFDLLAFAQQIAPFLAGELMKIRTPPVSALQPQQPVRQSTPPAQQPIASGAYQPPVNNPGNIMGGGGYPQGTAIQNQSQYWDLASQHTQNVPAQQQYGTGRPG